MNEHALITTNAVRQSFPMRHTRSIEFQPRWQRGRDGSLAFNVGRSTLGVWSSRTSNSQHPTPNAKLFLVLTLGLALLHTGCSEQTPSPSGMLAQVDGVAIDEASYRHGWNQRPPKMDTPLEREAMLERLIQRAAMAQAAREAGLDRDPAVVEQIENLLIGRLKETQLRRELESVHISEQEIRTDYEQNLATKFSVPERVRVAALWFNTRGQQPLVDRYTPRLEEAKVTAVSLPAEEGFGPLAIRNTEHRASRYKGGDLGWLEDNELAVDPWRQAVQEIAADLKNPGDFSPVRVTDQGLFVVRLIERQGAHFKSFESVRAGIEQRLLSRRRTELEEQFHQSILDRIAVHKFPERLRALGDLPVRHSSQETLSPAQLSANR